MSHNDPGDHGSTIRHTEFSPAAFGKLPWGAPPKRKGSDLHREESASSGEGRNRSASSWEKEEVRGNPREQVFLHSSGPVLRIILSLRSISAQTIPSLLEPHVSCRGWRQPQLRAVHHGKGRKETGPTLQDLWKNDWGFGGERTISWQSISQSCGRGGQSLIPERKNLSLTELSFSEEPSFKH